MTGKWKEHGTAGRRAEFAMPLPNLAERFRRHELIRRYARELLSQEIHRRAEFFADYSDQDGENKSDFVAISKLPAEFLTSLWALP